MAKKYVIGLAPGRSAFYCSETRMYLTKERTPQAEHPAEVPLSAAMKRGLAFQTLVDVLGNIPKEAYMSEKTKRRLDQAKSEAAPQKQEPTKAEPVPNQILDDEDDEDELDEATKALEEADEDEEILKEIAEEESEKLTEENTVTVPDDEAIDAMTRKEALALIEELGLSLGDLDLNSRATVDEIKTALKELRAQNL